jgi:hypothetical protein
VIFVSEVELILTALMAGAAAGTTAGATSAAQSAVVDAYTRLRELLRRVLTRPGRLDKVLDTVEAQPGTWQSELGAALTGAHADQDQQILAAARAPLRFSCRRLPSAAGGRSMLNIQRVWPRDRR